MAYTPDRGGYLTEIVQWRLRPFHYLPYYERSQGVPV